MKSRFKIQTRLAFGFAAGAALNVALFTGILYEFALVTGLTFLRFAGGFLAVIAGLAYLAGKVVGRRIECEDHATHREMREQIAVVHELMKANEYLETETLDLKKHRKALLSIMEDAEHSNQRLKREITERQRAQIEAAGAKENIEMILHGGDLGYWDWNIPNKIVGCNDRFTKMIGASLDTTEYTDVWRKKYVHPEDLPTTEHTLAQHLKGEISTYSCEYRLRRGANKWVWVLDRGQVTEWNPDRTPLRMAGTLLDITAQKEYEIQLKKTNQLLDKRSRELEENQHIIMGMMEDANEAHEGLESANRELLVAHSKSEQATHAKSEFLASMSHEIRTPMNGIIGTASLLGDTPLNTEQQEYLRIIHTSSDALLTLLNDILDFSKIEAGKLNLELQPFDLRETCEHITELLTPTALEKGIDLILRFSPDTPPWVVGDAGRIRQVLMNLISNALKFTQKGYVYIDVSAVAGTDKVTTIHFKIIDTGIGIAKKELAQLFEKFSQADSSSTRQFGGTGLGLAICKQLISLMKGKIGMESELGAGSTFWFRLNFPMSNRSTPAAIDQSIFLQEPVLIIDEKQIMGSVLAEWFTHWGLAVDRAAGVADAVEKIRKKPYRIILIEEYLAFSPDNPLFSESEFEGLPLFIICSITNRDYRALDRAGLATNLIKPIRLGNLLSKTAKALNYSLPQHPSNAAKPTVESSKITTLGTCRILVVEDNLVNQTVAKRMLTKSGFDVDVASDGEQAVKKVTGGARYDLIFMDCQMPKIDGYEAARQIREFENKSNATFHIPIIALTANAMQGDRDKCLDAGMDDYLSKPVKKETLNEMIRRHVG